MGTGGLNTESSASMLDSGSCHVMNVTPEEPPNHPFSLSQSRRRRHGGGGGGTSSLREKRNDLKRDKSMSLKAQIETDQWELK